MTARVPWLSTLPEPTAQEHIRSARQVNRADLAESPSCGSGAAAPWGLTGTHATGGVVTARSEQAAWRLTWDLA
jgi:hypothetical protein